MTSVRDSNVSGNDSASRGVFSSADVSCSVSSLSYISSMFGLYSLEANISLFSFYMLHDVHQLVSDKDCI